MPTSQVYCVVLSGTVKAVQMQAIHLDSMRKKIKTQKRKMAQELIKEKKLQAKKKSEAKKKYKARQRNVKKGRKKK